MYFHPNLPSPGNASDDSSSSQERRDRSFEPGIDHSSRRHGRAHKVLLPMDDSASALGAMDHLTGSPNRGRPLEVHVINVQHLVMRGDFALNAWRFARSGAPALRLLNGFWRGPAHCWMRPKFRARRRFFLATLDRPSAISLESRSSMSTA